MEKMPFGLINAPFTFQKLMDIVLERTLYQFTVVYMGDIFIYSKDIAKHKKHLRYILGLLNYLGFEIKIRKWQIARKRVIFLGYEVENGILTIPLKQKTRAIEHKIPKTLYELRSFSGFTLYFRHFIPAFAEKSDALFKY